MDQRVAAILPLMPTGSTVADAVAVISALDAAGLFGGSETSVDFSDLGGTKEIAAMLGCSKQSIANWRASRSRGGTGFPEPLLVLSATPVWSRTAVEQWFRNIPEAQESTPEEAEE